jgi:branched-chain amino acid transport system ATP-binding protein
MSEILSVRELTVTFAGLTAVSDVSLDVHAGTVLGIIGPNGSGKTTLLNAVSGLVPIRTGRLAVAGSDITRASVATRATAGVARTYQHIRLFPGMSARDNVAVGADCRNRPSRRRWLAARRAGERHAAAQSRRVDELMRLLGIEEHGGTTATDLPYGLQRRVEIARAIAGDPKVLLLDEPTAGMNAPEAAAIADVASVLRSQGMAVVLVEHNVELLMGLADEVVALNFGTRIAYGKPDVVRRDPEVVKAYLGSDD